MDFISSARRVTIQKRVDATNGGSAQVAKAIGKWRDTIHFLTDPETDLSRVHDLTEVFKKVLNFVSNRESRTFHKMIRYYLTKIHGYGREANAPKKDLLHRDVDQVVKWIIRPRQIDPAWVRNAGQTTHWGSLRTGAIMDRRALRMAIRHFVLATKAPNHPATANADGAYTNEDFTVG